MNEQQASAEHPWGDDSEQSPSDLLASERGTVAAGCVLTLGSALLTCLMLFINGSLVMAILISLAKIGPPWFSNPALMQFLLFSMPILLAVLEWMMIDYVRTRLSESSRRKRSHSQ